MKYRFSPKELRLLSNLSKFEARVRDEDDELITIKACPTFIRGYPKDGINCQDLAHRLKQYADEIENKRIYR